MTRRGVLEVLAFAAVLGVLALVLKVERNIRSDQLTIRHWIAHELRARRGEIL